MPQREKEQLDGDSYHYRTILTNIIAITIEAATEKKMSNLLENLLWPKLSSRARPFDE